MQREIHRLSCQHALALLKALQLSPEGFVNLVAFNSNQFIEDLKITTLSIRNSLTDLANDPQFKGRLVVDVTEILFFSPNPFFGDRPNKGLKYYKDLTLAQRAGLQLNKAIESHIR